MSKFPTLAKLVFPTSSSAFEAEYFERKPLVVRRNDSSYLTGLISTGDVEQLLTFGGLTSERVRLVADGQALDTAEYSYPSGLVDSIRCFQAYSSGATLIVSQANERHPELARFCRCLEAELSHRVQANVYLTPPSAGGFAHHFDNHDVFVQQVAGSKAWRLYESDVELPFPGEEYRPGGAPPGEPTAEFNLEPGDTLYLPRGWMHQARSIHAASLHVTFGILQTNWTELLLEAVAQAALKDARLRGALPLGYARSDFVGDQARERFGQLLQLAVQRADFDAALEHFAADFVGTRHPTHADHLNAQGAPLTEHTRLALREGVAWRLTIDRDALVLSCFGADLRMPVSWRPVIEQALTGTAFSCAELVGPQSGAERQAVVERLLREEILVVLPSPTSAQSRAS